MSQNEIIAKRLSELRKKKGIKQDEIAELLNVKRATVANYETGKRAPDYETIIKLADYYGVSCDYIIRGIKSEFAEVHNSTGLSNEAIEALQKIFKQSKGEYISDKYKQIIDELTDYINNSSIEFLNEQREKFNKMLIERENNKDSVLPKEAYYEYFDEWLFGFERDALELHKIENKKEAQIVIDALNYIIEKDDFFDFMVMIYVYLFADLDTSKGMLTGVASDSLNSDNGYFSIRFDKELINDSYLIRINNYLNKWSDRGKIKIFDLEICKEGHNNGND